MQREMHEESSHKYIIYYLNVTRTHEVTRDTISTELDRCDLAAWQAALETTHFFKRYTRRSSVATLSTIYYTIKKHTIDAPEDLKLGERKIHEDRVVFPRVGSIRS